VRIPTITSILTASPATHPLRVRWLGRWDYWAGTSAWWGTFHATGLLATYITNPDLSLSDFGIQYLVLESLAASHLLRVGLLFLGWRSRSWTIFSLAAVPLVIGVAAAGTGGSFALAYHASPEEFLAAFQGRTDVWGIHSAALASWALGIGSWTCSYLVFCVYRSYRKAARDRLRLNVAITDARLRALKSQINPHFLFNCLSTLRALIPREHDRAWNGVGSLAELLRTNLVHSGKESVALERELVAVDSYLALEQLRLGDRLRIQRTIDPVALDHAVPPFLLQTLVKAVMEAEAPMHDREEVGIEAMLDAGKLRLRVTGIGRCTNSTDTATARPTLVNTKKQLERDWGHAASLSLTQTGSDMIVATAILDQPLPFASNAVPAVIPASLLAAPAFPNNNPAATGTVASPTIDAHGHTPRDGVIPLSPAAYPAARRWLATPSYWAIQLAGWGAAGSIEALRTFCHGTGPASSVMLVATYATWAIGGLLLSHLLRLAVILLRLHRLSWPHFILGLLPWVISCGAAWCGLMLGFASVFFPEQLVLQPGSYAFFCLKPAHFLENWNGANLYFTAWLGFYMGFAYFLRHRDADLAQLRLLAASRDTELNILHTKTNPESLICSLHAIRDILPHGLDRPRAAVALLAGMIRSALELGEKKTVPLAMELAAVEQYLALEQLRFESRLRLRWSVSPTAAEWPVPPFILQTVVENAIKYGIGRREAGGEVGIDVLCHADALTLRVTNPGRIAPSTDSTGLGLANVRARLQLIYGDTALISLRQEEPDLVATTITVPRLPFDRTP
jgi:LytS/YehU family sensor histidine kinase